MSDIVSQILRDPKYHDLFSIIKGARNGFVYGVKIRFPHALVMTFLFSNRPLAQKLIAIQQATFTHAKNLAKFVTIYKILLLVQKWLRKGKGMTDSLAVGGGKGKGRMRDAEGALDTFVAGMVGGWWVFGERTAINEQIVLYVSSRVLASFLPRLISSGRNAAASPVASSSIPSFLLPYIPTNLLPRDPLQPLTAKEAYHKPIPPSDAPFAIFAAISWGLVMYVYRHRGEWLQPGMVNSMQYLYRDSEQWSSLKTLLWHNK